MKKKYEELILMLVAMRDEVIRTSAQKDPFDDEYKDPEFDE